jgi:hypothetical protein
MSTLEERIAADEQRLKAVDLQIATILEHVDNIRDNHLHTLQGDMNIVKTDIDWIKRWLWVVITASTGSVIATLIGLILKKT